MELVPFTREVGTVTPCNAETYPILDETVKERYSKCELLNIVQHIDIYGKIRTSYVEQNKLRIRGTDGAVSITSIASSSRKFSNLYDKGESITGRTLDAQLSRFSVTTKVSGLGPGHDLLSKKVRKLRLTNSGKDNFLCNTVLAKR